MFKIVNKTQCIECKENCPIAQFEKVVNNPTFALITQITDKGTELGLFPKPEQGAGVFGCIHGNGEITITNNDLIG